MAKYNPKHRRSIRNTKAYKNNTFLNSREARSLRVLCELEEPRVRLKRIGIQHMVSFFGSARLGESHPDYTAAYTIAYKLGEWLKKHTNNVGISSGGGPGIMEAVNAGAFDSGCNSIGMGISLPFEQRNNEFISTDLDFEFHYFFTRKYWCVYLSKAFVVMPGGVGTLDELSEILTLIQTKKITIDVPIVLYNSEFWNNTVNFQNMVDYGTISKSDLDLFTITDSVDETVKTVTQGLSLYLD